MRSVRRSWTGWDSQPWPMTGLTPCRRGPGASSSWRVPWPPGPRSSSSTNRRRVRTTDETQRFSEVLRSLANDGLAILLVEHDMELVMNVCNTVVVLDYGRVICTGTPAEIRADPEVQAAYLGTVSDGGADA